MCVNFRFIKYCLSAGTCLRGHFKVITNITVLQGFTILPIIIFKTNVPTGKKQDQMAVLQLDWLSATAAARVAPLT